MKAYAGLLILILFIFDQYSKYLIRLNFDLFQHKNVFPRNQHKNALFWDPTFLDFQVPYISRNLAGARLGPWAGWGERLSDPRVGQEALRLGLGYVLVVALLGLPLTRGLPRQPL